MSDIKEISPNTLVAFGIIGGLAGIYLTYILPAAGKMAGGPVEMILFGACPTAGALGGICAVVWEPNP